MGTTRWESPSSSSPSSALYPFGVVQVQSVSSAHDTLRLDDPHAVSIGVAATTLVGQSCAMDERARGRAGGATVGAFVNIDVDDLARAEAFYTTAFGLRVGRRLGDDFLELLGAPIPIYLLVKAAGSLALPGGGGARSYARHWTPVHLDLVVDDIDAAIARAEAAGARVEEGISQHGYGKLALLADPFGHGFCLLQLEGEGYDALVTG